MPHVYKRPRIPHTDDPEEFGMRLKEARDYSGMSQRELAFEGCGPAFISRIEIGERTPSLQVCKELALRLSVDLDWLCWGEASDPLKDLDEQQRFAVKAFGGKPLKVQKLLARLLKQCEAASADPSIPLNNLLKQTKTTAKAPHA
jgi:transcriptional regulator with XRE-family HTH domain